jgi:hypothetical protein
LGARFSSALLAFPVLGVLTSNMIGFHCSTGSKQGRALLSSSLCGRQGFFGVVDGGGHLGFSDGMGGEELGLRLGHKLD